jgi:serine/threonine protein kinase
MEFIERYDNGLWRIESLIGEGSFGKVYKISKEEHGYVSASALKVMSVPYSSEWLYQRISEGMDEGSISQYLDNALRDIMNEIKFLFKHSLISRLGLTIGIFAQSFVKTPFLSSIIVHVCFFFLTV